MNKKEIIQKVITMLQDHEDSYQDSIWSLVEEALKTRTVAQLKTWIEDEQ